MKVVGYILMLLALIMGHLSDINKLPVRIEVGVATSFIIFLIGVYILCKFKDK